MTTISPNNRRRVNYDRCEQTTLGTCDEGTVNCCAVVACDLCLRILDDYDEVLTAGSAPFVSSGYEGSVGGYTFSGHWSKDPYTNECLFTVVISEGEYDEQTLVFTKCEDGVTCQNPAGETTVTYDGQERTLTWSAMEAITLPHVEVSTNPCEGIDVAFVLDITSSMSGVIADLKASIGDVVATITGISSNYQLALHTFRDEVYADVAFSIGNASEFTAALNAITVSGGAGIPEASDYALTDSVAQTGWRSTARKIVILVTDAPPGGLDDVDDPEDAERLYAAAGAAKVNDQFLLAVRSGSSSLTATILSNAATEAEGKYLPDADDLPAEIQALLQGLCPEGLCRVPFCGTCKCATKKLCITLSGVGCSETLVVDPDEDYCGPIPEWSFTLTCGDFTYTGTIALLRDETSGGCVLTLSGGSGGYDDAGQTQTITECRALSGSFTVSDGDEYDAEEYSLTFSAADCDACVESEPCPDGCCFAPDTLNPEAPPAYSIDLVLTAPNCSDLDGEIITLSVNGGSVAKDCGFCTPFAGLGSGNATGTEDLDPNPTPCGKGVFLVLDCDGTSTTGDISKDVCCVNARLRGALVAGAAVAQDDWDQLATLPMLSCSCEDRDPPPAPPGMSAVWDASGLADLYPTCIWDQPGCVNLEGATLAL